MSLNGVRHKITFWGFKYLIDPIATLLKMYGAVWQVPSPHISSQCFVYFSVLNKTLGLVEQLMRWIFFFLNLTWYKNIPTLRWEDLPATNTAIWLTSCDEDSQEAEYRQDLYGDRPGVMRRTWMLLLRLMSCAAVAVWATTRRLSWLSS